MGEIGQPMSLSVWAKSDDSSNQNGVVSQRFGGNGEDVFELVRGAGINGMNFRVNTGSGSLTGVGTSFIPTNGQWHHYVGIYDGSTVRLFVDGVQRGGSVELTGSIITSSNTGGIGRGESVIWDGLVDEVRTYNRALSTEEVRRLYNMGR